MTGRLPRRIRSLVAIAAILGLAACGGHVNRYACPRLNEFRYRLDGSTGSSADTRRAMAPLMAAMTSALSRAPDARTLTTAPHSILVLSGGGPWGAFGAGFLSGWSAATGHPRPPAFDLVTGVSTGALQATSAFLGPRYDGQLVDAYRITRESELIDRRGTLLGTLFGAFAGTAPLEARLRRALAPLYAPVAAEARRGRLLLVGTVDALDGRMYAIDLTGIAGHLSGAEREGCYVGALMASSAVPVEFDRVEVGGRPYFDGGVRRSVFVTDIQLAAGSMRGSHAADRLYILVNGDPAAERIAHLDEGLLPTLARLRTLAVNQIETASIAGVAAAAPHGFETFIATAADQRCGASDDGHDVVFSPRFMACLEADGRGRWRASDPWVRYGAAVNAGTPARAP